MPQPGTTRRGLLVLSGGAALASAMAGAREPAHGSGTSKADRARDPAIDTHIHLVEPGLPGIKPKPEDIQRLYQGPPSKMAERFKTDMEQANIKVAFGMGSLGGDKGDPLGVAHTLELAKSVPGLKAIGVADPRRIEPEHLRPPRCRSSGTATRSSP